MSLTIAKREIGEVTVLDLAGDSAIADGTILNQTVRGLTDAGKRLFVLNLQNVRYMDSFGLGQIVSTFLSVRDQKGKIRVVNPNAKIRDLLRYSRVDTVLQVMPSEAEAVQELQKPATA